MSQTDTFDPKEKRDVGGKSKPQKTQSPDLLLSDQLPKLAQQAKNLSVIRSLTTKTGAHSQARYVMHTGYRQRTGMTHPQLDPGHKCSLEITSNTSFQRPYC